jgi:murein DD-endopeptidase MepM/ murein hydrolase activator NlpD
MTSQTLFYLLISIILILNNESLAQPHLDDFRQSELNRMMNTAQANIDSLGLTVVKGASPVALTLLISPVRESPFNRYFLSTLISNFVDHNPVYGALQDYNCGTRTYDKPSGGHRGTDWAINPFRWKMMDDQVVSVVAAATGVIVFKEDGHYDRNYNAPDSASNTIILWHPTDGTRALYLHMKKHSLTAKNIGDTLYAGEFIGYIGSSGVSTGPHLHFEIRDSSNNSVDPFYGPCNTGIQSSWWMQQHPYYDTDIMSISMHTKLVDWGNNKNDTEVTYESDHFAPGDSIKFMCSSEAFIPMIHFNLKFSGRMDLCFIPLQRLDPVSFFQAIIFSEAPGSHQPVRRGSGGLKAL